MELEQILTKLNDNNTKNMKTNTSVGLEVGVLIMENDIDGAINYVKDFFSCDYIVATQAVNIFKNKMDKLHKKNTIQSLSPEQIAHNQAVAREWQNIPKCPTCSSTNIKKIGSISKVAGAITFGIFSKTAKSQFKCNNCGYKW